MWVCLVLQESEERERESAIESMCVCVCVDSLVRERGKECVCLRVSQEREERVLKGGV